MRLRACTREKEVAEVLDRGYWPDACARELRTHIEGCSSCRELMLVKQAFRRERAVASAQPPRLESPGALWWRAQLRRRNAALERIGRPFLGAQIFAVVLMLIAALGFLGWQFQKGLIGSDWIESLPRALHVEVLLPASLQGSTGTAWLVLLVIALGMVAGGVVVYVASEKQ